uniref:EXS domain-containing protein n=1 Tax=Panagrellus redivivus TaxID=6233 RepID=A0A7E4VHU2_PANRE
MVESQDLVETSISMYRKQYQTGLNPHLPRLRFYESTGTYIVTALLLILYIVTAGVHFELDASVAYHVPLISAISTLLPYLFLRYFDYMPNLFHQVCKKDAIGTESA